MPKNNLKLAIEIENKVSNLGEAEKYTNNLEQICVNTDHLRKISRLLAEVCDGLDPAVLAQRMPKLRIAMSKRASSTFDLEKGTEKLARANKKAAKSKKTSETAAKK